MGKRILIAANYYPPTVIGGAEIVAHRHAKLLLERGYSVSVFTRDRNISSESNYVDMIDGINVTRFHSTKSFPENNFIIPEAASCFEALLKSSKPDIVHFHNVVELGVNLIRLAKARGFKTVLTLHDPWGFCMRHTLIRDEGNICEYFDQCASCQWDIATGNGYRIPIRLRSDYIRWCVSKADVMISPSSWLKANYEKAGYDQSHIVKLSNGANLNAVIPILRTSRTCLQFLYVGTIADHKGVDYLLDAAAKLLAVPELNGRWQLTLAGDGPKKGMIVARIRELQTEAISYIGSVEHAELMQSLSRYDVVILPSIWPENQSAVLLEAMASGAAQIATALGGNAELVEHAKSGFLVTPRSAAALANAMRIMIEEPDLLERFSAQNLARRSVFDDNNTVAKLIEFYDRLELRTVSDDQLIICAGGEPPPEVAWLINTYSSGTQLRSKVTLMWEEWATDYEWQKACAVWNWGSVVDSRAVAGARKFKLPLLIPDDPSCNCNTLTDVRLLTYGDASEALSQIDGLVATRRLM